MDNKLEIEIQDLIHTMQEGWLENIKLLFQKIENPSLMHKIIKNMEQLNFSWKSKEVENTICELNGIYWQKHHKKGQEKLLKLVFPVENYAEIYRDQLQNNRNAIAKWNMHQLDN